MTARVAPDPSSRCPLNTPLGVISPLGRSSPSREPNPKRLMYLYIVSFPSFSPTSPKTVLTECVRPSVSEIVPKLAPPSFCSGTPLMILLFCPLISESGV